MLVLLVAPYKHKQLTTNNNKPIICTSLTRLCNQLSSIGYLLKLTHNKVPLNKRSPIDSSC